MALIKVKNLPECRPATKAYHYVEPMPVIAHKFLKIFFWIQRIKYFADSIAQPFFIHNNKSVHEMQQKCA